MNGGSASLADSFVDESSKGPAGRAGLDAASPRPVDAILADLQEAARLGVNGTPTFVIDGVVYEKPVTWAERQKLVAPMAR